MLRRLAQLKARPDQPLPAEFAALARPAQAPQLLEVYRSAEFARLLRSSGRSSGRPTAAQLLAFSAPPAPFWLLEHCPDAVPLAVRAYLRRRDLASAFSALRFVPRPRQSMLGLAVGSLGCTAGVWPLPLGALIAGFWCGLGVAAVLPPRLEHVRWQRSTPAGSRNPAVLALCDHIVAWFEDCIGSTTENWHRIQHGALSERELDRRLLELGVERQPRQDQLYADYWSGRGDFCWREPDQDPCFWLQECDHEREQEHAHK